MYASLYHQQSFFIIVEWYRQDLMSCTLLKYMHEWVLVELCPGSIKHRFSSIVGWKSGGTLGCMSGGSVCICTCYIDAV